MDTSTFFSTGGGLLSQDMSMDGILNMYLKAVANNTTPLKCDWAYYADPVDKLCKLWLDSRVNVNDKTIDANWSYICWREIFLNCILFIFALVYISRIIIESRKEKKRWFLNIHLPYIIFILLKSIFHGAAFWDGWALRGYYKLSTFMVLYSLGNAFAVVQCIWCVIAIATTYIFHNKIPFNIIRYIIYSVGGLIMAYLIGGYIPWSMVIASRLEKNPYNPISRIATYLSYSQYGLLIFVCLTVGPIVVFFCIKNLKDFTRLMSKEHYCQPYRAAAKNFSLYIMFQIANAIYYIVSQIVLRITTTKTILLASEIFNDINRVTDFQTCMATLILFENRYNTMCILQEIPQLIMYIYNKMYTCCCIRKSDDLELPLEDKNDGLETEGRVKGLYQMGRIEPNITTYNKVIGKLIDGKKDYIISRTLSSVGSKDSKDSKDASDVEI